jgi:hypothetical protein
MAGNWRAPQIRPAEVDPDSDTELKKGKYEGWSQEQLDTEAAVLYTTGMTQREVAAEMGCSLSAVSARIKRATDSAKVLPVQSVKQIQLDSLARQKRIVLGVMAQPGLLVSHGRVIFDPNSGSPMVDKDMILKASAELRRIEELVSRLAGTRAPVTHEVREITEDAIDAELRKLVEQLGSAAEGGSDAEISGLASQLGDALQRGEAPTPQEP